MSNARTTIRIVIADDQELVRAGLRQILEAEEDFRVVAEVPDGDAAVAAVRSFEPDVALLDIRMPKVDGVEAARRIAALESSTTVVMLTTFGTEEHVFASLEAGASGFLLKDAGARQLIDAVRVAAGGDSVLSPAVARLLIDRTLAGGQRRRTADLQDRRIATLTAREADVLERMARGLSNADIARDLLVGEATVKTHVAQVLAKLGVRSRVQAVIYAYESGFVDGRGHGVRRS